MAGLEELLQNLKTGPSEHALPAPSDPAINDLVRGASWCFTPSALCRAMPFEGLRVSSKRLGAAEERAQRCCSRTRRRQLGVSGCYRLNQLLGIAKPCLEAHFCSTVSSRGYRQAIVFLRLAGRKGYLPAYLLGWHVVLARTCC